MIVKGVHVENEWVMTLRKIVRLLPKAVQENMAKSIMFTTVFQFSGREKELTH